MANDDLNLFMLNQLMGCLYLCPVLFIISMEERHTKLLFFISINWRASEASETLSGLFN